MNLLDKIIEHYYEEHLLKADGFDDAVIGIDYVNMRLIYSVKKVLDILSKDMSFEDALEYFEFNIQGSYVGEKTPIWCHDLI